MVPVLKKHHRVFVNISEDTTKSPILHIIAITIFKIVHASEKQIVT